MGGLGAAVRFEGIASTAMEAPWCGPPSSQHHPSQRTLTMPELMLAFHVLKDSTPLVQGRVPTGIGSFRPPFSATGGCRGRELVAEPRLRKIRPG